MNFERPLKAISDSELQLELALRAGPRYKCQAKECGALHNSATRFDNCPTCGRKGYLSGGFVRDPDSPQWKDWMARMVALYREQGKVPVVAVQNYLLEDDLAALQRFAECCDDSESGGHDVSKDRIARLREIGVLETKGFGRHQITTFGGYVLGLVADESPVLPLKTYADYDEAACVAHAEKLMLHEPAAQVM